MFTGSSRCVEVHAASPHEWFTTTSSPEETWALGRKLGLCLQVGDVVGLDGELGVGKTQFVQGILAGMDFDPHQVTSPTFTLIQEYLARIPVCHLDVYRLKDSDEFLELGVDELLGGSVVCLIEWSNRVADVLPPDRLQVMLWGSGEYSRDILITASGNRSVKRLGEFRLLVDGTHEPPQAGG